MSKAQLEKFVAAVSSNPSMLTEATKGAEDPTQTVTNIMQYSKSKGYDFTEEEAAAWIGEHQKELKAGELSDTQLESVAGGFAKGSDGFNKAMGQIGLWFNNAYTGK